MLIGIDVGGTKNELVLCEDDGRVRAHMIGPGTNASEFGEETACRVVAEQVKALLKGYEDRPIAALHAGMAGGAAPQSKPIINALLRGYFPQIPRIGNDSDSLNGLYACVGVRDGMVVIAGTGTSAFVRQGGKLSQVGGWGYLIDDAGGGYAMGRAALNAAFRDYDGRGESTILTRLCEEKLGTSMAEGIPALYRGGKRFVADFALLALQAADEGDGVALDIVGWTCDELALLIRTCASRLSEPPYHVALCGSIWKSQRVLAGVAVRLGDDYCLMRATLPPVFGATVAAAELAGLDWGDSFRDAFRQTLDTAPMVTPGE